MDLPRDAPVLSHGINLLAAPIVQVEWVVISELPGLKLPIATMEPWCHCHVPGEYCIRQGWAKALTAQGRAMHGELGL